METMEGGGREPLDPLEGPHATGPTSGTEQRRSWLSRENLSSRAGISGAVFAVLLVASLALLILGVENKISRALAIVVVSVAVCAALWVGANLLFDQARNRWQRFQTLW